jgi:hypothetical protein
VHVVAEHKAYEERVPLPCGQHRDPPLQLLGRRAGILLLFASFGRDRDQVLVEAEKVGQAAQWRVQRRHPRRDRRLGIVVGKLSRFD